MKMPSYSSDRTHLINHVMQTEDRLLEERRNEKLPKRTNRKMRRTLTAVTRIITRDNAQTAQGFKRRQDWKKSWARRGVMSCSNAVLRSKMGKKITDLPSTGLFNKLKTAIGF